MPAELPLTYGLVHVVGLLLCSPIAGFILAGGGAGSRGGFPNSTSIGSSDLAFPICALTLVLSHVSLLASPPLIDIGTAPGPGGGWLFV